MAEKIKIPSGPAGECNENASEDPVPPTIQLEQVSGFWEKYNKAANFEDREFVKAAGGNLDTLLIFAGLFSGVNTAFIIESLKTVQPDQAAKTNDLLRSVILTLQNTTTPNDPLYNLLFVPSTQSVRCTTMFFASLSCSLAAAFGAVLGKQWLNHYEREGRLKPPAERGRERQKKYDGRAQWYMEGIIEIPPTILQISLFLFLGALIDFLWPISQTSGGVVMGFSLALACFFLVTTAIAAIYPLSPFQTRLSITIHGVSVTLHTIFGTCLSSTPRIKIALRDLVQHPLAELMDILRLEDHIDKLPDVFGPVCVIVAAVLLWPLCILWRFVQSTRKLVRYSIRHAIAPHKHRYHPTPDTKDTILDLKCLIFSAKRASTSGDFDQLFMAMDAMPTGLQLHPNEPTLGLISETILKFIIKPTTTPLGSHTSLNPCDFQHLVKPLHLLYSSWKYLPDPDLYPPSSPYFKFSRYTIMIWRELWAVLALDLQNITSAALIADMFDLAIVRPSTSSKDPALIQKLLIPVILDKTDKLPYVRLLAISMDNSSHPSFPEGTDASKLVPTILSVLEDETGDLVAVSGRVWCSAFPDYLGGTPLELGFSKYLAKCFRTYLVGDKTYGEVVWEDRLRLEYSTQVLGSCLTAVYKLLRRNYGGSSWPRALENNGFPPLLLQTVLQIPEASAKAFAILCFLFLLQNRCADRVDVPHQNLDLYLSPDSVAVLAENLPALQYYSPINSGIDDQVQAQDFLEQVVQFFEAASRLGLLKRGMESDVGRFRWEGDDQGESRPHIGYLYRQVDPGLLRDMYARMDGLVYA